MATSIGSRKEEVDLRGAKRLYLRKNETIHVTDVTKCPICESLRKYGECPLDYDTKHAVSHRIENVVEKAAKLKMDWSDLKKLEGAKLSNRLLRLWEDFTTTLSHQDFARAYKNLGGGRQPNEVLRIKGLSRIVGELLIIRKHIR